MCCYASSQTFTQTVFEYLQSFVNYSNNNWSYISFENFDDPSICFDLFDAIVVHYSVRLPFGQLNARSIDRLARFHGIRALFIQDEYDHTNLTKSIIKWARFDVVFTVVPPQSLASVYPPDEFPGVRFVSNFTGYVPDNHIEHFDPLVPPSQRSLMIAYRGRPLPIRYGRLGQEKVAIGARVKSYCLSHKIPCDIAWDEQSRIYGDAWYRFISSSKSMLGSESGSNVFDWDGTLQIQIENFKKLNPGASDELVYQNVIEPCEVDGLMNQISPRIFEMAAAKTVMVLFEGAYSNVLIPNRHYIPLRKDFSNLDDVFEFLRDDVEVDAMANRTYRDLIESEKYSYKQFVAMVDRVIEASWSALAENRLSTQVGFASPHPAITRVPNRADPPIVPSSFEWKMQGMLYFVWRHIPNDARPYIKRLLGRG